MHSHAYEDEPQVDIQIFLDAVIGGKAKTHQFKPLFDGVFICEMFSETKYVYFVVYDIDKAERNEKELTRFNSVAKSKGYEYASSMRILIGDEQIVFRYIKRKDKK